MRQFRSQARTRNIKSGRGLTAQKGFTMAVSIISKSNGLNERQTFKILQGNNLGRLRDNVGRKFDIVEYVRYLDTKADGTEQSLLAIVTSDGDIIATNSGTAVRSFDAMLEAGFTVPIADVEVYAATTKSGRQYCDLVLV